MFKKGKSENRDTFSTVWYLCHHAEFLSSHSSLRTPVLLTSLSRSYPSARLAWGLKLFALVTSYNVKSLKIHLKCVCSSVISGFTELQLQIVYSSLCSKPPPPSGKGRKTVITANAHVPTCSWYLQRVPQSFSEYFPFIRSFID